MAISAEPQPAAVQTNVVCVAKPKQPTISCPLNILCYDAFTAPLAVQPTTAPCLPH